MSLNAYAAEARLKILSELQNGQPPSLGVYDESALREGRMKGEAQLGSTRFTPTEITVEFIFPDTKSSATVLCVTIESPERIVYMPVPSWVVESIWQGSISGSYHFESDAKALAAKFLELLEVDQNRAQFEPATPTRRE